MPVPARPPPVVRSPERKEDEDEQAARATEEQEDSEQNSEEAARARRAAIAARMAAMGGRGFGMYGGGAVPTAAPTVQPSHSSAPTSKPPQAPLATPPPIPGVKPKKLSQDDVAGAVSRAPPPPPVPPVSQNRNVGGENSESEAELLGAATDEEGEMVYEEVEEPEIIEPPPPAIPSRSGRPPVPRVSRAPPPAPDQEESQHVSPPALPSGRRPPPRAAPIPAPPPSNEQATTGDEDEDASYPAHPTRKSSRPPPPAPSAEPSVPASLESSGQWEMPNFPKMSLDLSNFGSSNATADQSWTKVDEEDLAPESSTSKATAPASKAPVAASASAPASSRPLPFTGPSPNPVSSDMLYYLSQTLGPKVLSSAQNVHEKSKRMVIGDGSSVSFISTVLSSVNASTNSLGHLIYAQVGGAVQKRLGDIMPGDVVALHAANFKGHKGGLGLGGGYSASYGTKEEPVLAVVCEFEGKKSKIRAFAVNQHANVYPVCIQHCHRKRC